MSPLREVLSGTVWVVGARWGMRAIGLVSTVILARLLGPQDFGVLALALLVVGGIEVFGYTGMVNYIIRHPDPKRSHFDTVFTLQLMVGAVLSVVMFVVAPYGAVFFDEPQIELVIRCLALRPLLSGLENPGIIWFRKKMNFSKDFEFLVLNKAVSFVLTVGSAFVLRSYWALVIGILSGGVVSLIQSYRMHPFRPRLSLAETSVMWRYSSWALISSLLDFANSKIDGIIVGRVHSAAEMGYYNVGAEIAATPVKEVIYPMTRVWEPAFAKLAGDPAALEHTYRWVFSAVAIAAFSMSAGVALVAHDITVIALGTKWLPTVPLMQLLALAAGLSAISVPTATVLWATRDLHIFVALNLLQFVLLLSNMLPAALWYGLVEVAMGRAVGMGLNLVVTLMVFERIVGLPPLTLLRTVVRPLLATLAMCGVVWLVRESAPEIPTLRLAMCAASGALSFGVALLALWMLAGRPASVETDALRWAAGQGRALRKRWAA